MTAGGPSSRKPLRLAGAAPVALLLLAAAADPYEPLRGFWSGSTARGLTPDHVPGLVDALFFLPKARRAEAVAALEALTGEKPGNRYHDWVEVVARRTDLKPAPGYAAWKGELFARIDPRYRAILGQASPARIRLEEIVWGGVPFEGIPALDRPAAVSAGAAARWMTDAEQVFGVHLGGEARAYPLRILGWHEMANDVVGGRAVTLSYCTLCGSGVLFDAGRFTFGTSGLLYRSNKLMVDRQTGTLWSNLTGEPVLGSLARDSVAETLRVLPLTLTTWKDWRTRHPGTTVLDLDRGRAARWGYDYTPGAADRKREGVSFPAGPRDRREPRGLDGRAEVFAVRLGRLAKAYEMDALLRERVVNDRLGEHGVVVVADPESGAARAYRSGGRTFAPGARPDELVDETGVRWTAGDEALAPTGPEAIAVDPPKSLERIPGHQAFWFGWYAFFPDSGLYRGSGGTQ